MCHSPNAGDHNSHDTCSLTMLARTDGCYGPKYLDDAILATPRILSQHAGLSTYSNWLHILTGSRFLDVKCLFQHLQPNSFGGEAGDFLHAKHAF